MLSRFYNYFFLLKNEGKKPIGIFLIGMIFFSFILISAIPPNSLEEHHGRSHDPIYFSSDSYIDSFSLYPYPISGDPPIALPDTVSLLQASSISGNVLTNDSDPDGDALVINPIPKVLPSNGTVTINEDGSFTYVPFPAFVGTDQFTYEVCDGGSAETTTSYWPLDLPQLITPFGTPTITSIINVPTGGTITDVNIPRLFIEHSWVEDLVISVTSPSGTTVTLTNQLYCWSEDYDIGFDDDSPQIYTSIPCPPTGGGLYQPTEPLSLFNNEDAAGNWILTVQDILFWEGGSVNDWELEITASGGGAGTFCSEATVTALVYSSSSEICSNGVDDDQDGLVDGFDPDCPCEDENFFGMCSPECEYDPPSVPNFDIKVDWEGTDSVNTFTPVVAGDLDGDPSSVEIVAFKSNLLTYIDQPVFVIDGTTGETKYTFDSKPMHVFNKGFALADADKDGRGEIYYVVGRTDAADFRKIACYEYNPNGSNLGGTGTGSFDLQWVSDERVTCGLLFPLYNITDNFAVNLADFDGNGTPEIYVGNEIYDAITGQQLAAGGANNFGNNIYDLYIHEHFHANPVAMDVLPSNACSDCKGLELVAGNQVYTVNLSTGAMTVERELTTSLGHKDGSVALADYDLDGDVDAVVTTNDAMGSYLYVWDMQTETMIGDVHIISDTLLADIWYRSTSNATIADFDGDNKPEIGVVSNFVFQVVEDYETDISGKGGVAWSMKTTDKSGMTGLTSFDFNADGLSEVVYRDENDLRIVSGLTGQNLATFTCASRTGAEYPIVLDVDNDYETELVCTCGPGVYARNGKMMAFRSDTYPWVPTRKLWNQYAYFITNVNDDLSIPPMQQPHHLVGNPPLGSTGRMNTFLKQVGPYNNEGQPVYAAADIQARFLNAGLDDCVSDSLEIIIRFYNEGDLGFPAKMPFAIYEGNPELNGILFKAFEIPIAVIPNDSVDVTIKVANNELSLPIEIFVIGNDDGSLTIPLSLDTDFPVTSIGECDFRNNMDSLQLVGCETEPPVFSIIPSDVTVDCNTIPDAPTIIASDNCTPNISVVFTESIGTGCPYFIIRKWVAEDDCGNRDSISQVITIEDNTPPTLTNIPSDVTVDCNSIPDTAQVLASDNCNHFDLYFTENISSGCPYTITRTWTATDSCQNLVTTTQIITVQDNSTPVLNNLPSDVTVDCNAIPDTALVTVLDDCENVLLDFVEVESSGSCIDSKNITRTWTATDVCGNEVSFTQNISVINCSPTAVVSVIPSSNICEGESTSLEISLSQGFTSPNYQWQFSTDEVNWSNITGANTNTYEFTVTPFNVGFYRVIIANTLADLNNSSCSVISNTQSISMIGSVVQIETLNEAICGGDSILIGNSTYNQAGNYTDTLIAISGCDSAIINLTLEVNESYQVVIDSTICQGESVIIGNSTFNISGEHEVTLNTMNGCDSIVFFNLTVDQNYNATINAEICQGETFEVGGISFSTNGTHQANLINVNGCDSVINLNLTVHPYYNEITEVSICQGEVYDFDGVTYSSSGIYTNTFTSINGCDSLITLDLSVRNDETTMLNEMICSGQSITIGNTTYNATGVYSNILQSGIGCDSTVILNLVVSDQLLTDLNESICEGESYEVGGTSYNSTGTYQTTIQSSMGCDSVVTLELTVNQNFTESISVSICEGESYQVGNSFYTDTGIYMSSLSSINGCDSIVKVDLVVKPVYEEFIYESICEGDVFEVNGTSLIDAGIYPINMTSTNGCDSIVNITLIVNPVTSENLMVEICEGESYFAEGINQVVSGIYQDVYKNINNCDSIVTTELNVHPKFSSNFSATICSGEFYTIGNETFTTSGVHTVSMQTINGCDSVVTLELEANDVIVNDLFENICEGESVTMGSNTYENSGIYQEIYQSITGCDSIVNLTLTVNPNVEENINVTICEGDSFHLGNTTYTESGIYVQNLQSIFGCDSIVHLTLDVLLEIKENVEASICEGEVYQIGNNTYTQAGIYIDTLQATFGCDSIILFSLNVEPIVNKEIEASICEGGSYQLGDSIYTTSGTYQEVLTSNAGCDSIINLNLTVHQNYNLPIGETICQNEFYQVGETIYTESGLYTDTLITKAGCDSIIMLSLNVLPVFENNIQATLCPGEMYTLGDTEYGQSGVYLENFTAVNGCDSVVTLYLDVVEVQPTAIYQDLCEGDSIFLQGAYQTQGGIFTNVEQAVSGCDSMIYTYLTLVEEPISLVQKIICEGDSILLGGEYQYEAGEFIDTLNSSLGCDSIVIYELLLDPFTDIYVEELEVCRGEDGQFFVEGATQVKWFPTQGLSCDNCPNPIVSVNSSKTYTVSALSCLGGVVEATASVIVQDPPALYVTEDATIIKGESITLQASTSDITDVIVWREGSETICDNCTALTVSPEVTTTYLVSTEDENGCETIEAITVKVRDGCQYGRLEIPNMISPNGDGYNDRFEIRFEGFNELSSLKIYNRWGELVFETNDMSITWDGTFRGKALNPGVYVYYLEGVCLNEEAFFHTGNITILK